MSRCSASAMFGSGSVIPQRGSVSTGCPFGDGRGVGWATAGYTASAGFCAVVLGGLDDVRRCAAVTLLPRWPVRTIHDLADGLAADLNGGRMAGMTSQSPDDPFASLFDDPELEAVFARASPAD